MVRIQTDQTEKIKASILNISGIPVIGLTDVWLSISRKSDGKFFDFSDSTFKASGWTSRIQAMSEIVPSPQPVDITGDTDGSTGAITGMTDTTDFKVGDYATVSDGFPDTDIAYRIIALTGTSVTLDVNSTSVVNNVTVTGYHEPGQYEYDFDTSTIVSPVADDIYFIIADSPSGGNTPLQDELRVGDFVDNINVTISSRSSHSDPDPSGYIDTAISGRSSHSAADVWSVATRTLTSFGTLVADIWVYATRILTAGTKDTEIDTIKVKTDNLPADPASETNVNANETKIENIQSRLPSALISGKMNADTTAISGSSDAADKLEVSARTIVIGAAVTGTLSTTEMTTDLTEATNDHYNGRIIIWTSGVLKDQATDITDYDGAAKKLTYTATTEAPSNGDTFVIV